MFRSFAAAAIATVASADQISSKFMEHVIQFEKSFATVEEFLYRKHIFAQLDAEIEAENALGNNFTLGHNQFSTYSKSEFTKMLGFVESLESYPAKAYTPSNANYSPVDWRTEGAVTPVKDQGQCGSCWTFSSTGAAEGAHQILSGDLLSFSEQQLVDCAKFIAFGCNGGNEATAFNYLKKHPIMSEASYPYTGVDTADCLQDDSAAYDIYVADFIAVTPNSVDALKAALADGPVSVNIEADKLVFQTYSTGVLDSTKCGTTIDHAVLAVGWGTDATAGDYYIVKNSWASTWGDAGYIKIAAVDGIGICGIQSGPYQPTVTA
jgi:C1A family cysteine protease